MYKYEVRTNKGNWTAQIYFQDLDRTYNYDRNKYGGKYDIDFDLVKEALRILVNTMINQRQVINTPEHVPGSPGVCPLDWQTELRLRISNWFLAHDLKSFDDISKGYKFRTGMSLSLNSLKTIEDLFDATKELNLLLVFELIRAFEIPFKVNVMEMDVG